MFGSGFVLRASAVVQSVRDVGCVWVKVRTSGIYCGSVCERCTVFWSGFVLRASAGVQSVRSCGMFGSGFVLSDICCGSWAY